VAVLHDIQQAIEYFERLILIKDGKILADIPSQPPPSTELELLYEMKLERISRPGRKDILIPSIQGTHARPDEYHACDFQ
jgi:iron complex transport system ATP-binding protein